ncbi:MAG TPA: hypothetical protein VHO24_11405 [Opitutaceae bacterium]|nr:hypothetical protein [Opitutaceae bacterium]
MGSKEELVADLKRKIHAIEVSEAENAVFQFVTLGMEQMNLASIRVFRAEIARHPDMEKLLTLIDGHLALREILGNARN